MNKNQISFAFAGLLFGFLVGFIVAHQIYQGRGTAPGFQHPPIPAGMTAGPTGGGNGAMPPAGAGGSGGAPMAGGAADGAPDTATMEQVQKEIAALKAQVEKEPTNAQALTRLGDMYFDAGMFEKAKPYYERALAAAPGDVNIQTDLGTVLRNMGAPREALEHFEAAVSADPQHWKGWFNIGVVALYDLHDFEKAQQAFDKVSALRPGSIDMTALKQEIEKIRAEHAAASSPAS